MIELKRLKLINWHNFENVTFDCARLTYMIGVNAVGKTTILDAIRYCLTTNRNFNALGNKKSGRTLQGSVHAKQRGENAYRRPGHTVAYIGAEFWDSVKRTPFVIAVRVESEGPMQELHPGDQTWYLSEDGCTLEQLPFIDPKTGAPSAKEDFKPAAGRLSYTRSPSEARDRICRALGIGRASSPLGRKVAPNNVNDDLFNEKIPFREVLVINANGEQLGVMSKKEALDIAYKQNLDLLCVAPKARPAVCKVLDYGRYHFEQQKKAKEAKRKQHVVEVKSLRLSPIIDTHDFETKVRQTSKWIEAGMKVKIDMRFRGRLITRLEVGRKIMNDFIEAMDEVAIVEKKPSMEGNTMSTVLAPKKK